MKKILIIILLCIFVPSVYCGDGEKTEKKTDKTSEDVENEPLFGKKQNSREKKSGSSGIWILTFISLLIGAGSLGTLAYINKKYKNLQTGKVLEKVHITSKHQVCLVEIDNKKLLIGVSPDNMTLFGETKIEKD